MFICGLFNFECHHFSTRRIIIHCIRRLKMNTIWKILEIPADCLNFVLNFAEILSHIIIKLNSNDGNKFMRLNKFDLNLASRFYNVVGRDNCKCNIVQVQRRSFFRASTIGVIDLRSIIHLVSGVASTKSNSESPKQLEHKMFVFVPSGKFYSFFCLEKDYIYLCTETSEVKRKANAYFTGSFCLLLAFGKRENKSYKYSELSRIYYRQRNFKI